MKMVEEECAAVLAATFCALLRLQRRWCEALKPHWRLPPVASSSSKECESLALVTVR